jgi:hypothetical protein
MRIPPLIEFTEDLHSREKLILLAGEENEKRMTFFASNIDAGKKFFAAEQYYFLKFRLRCSKHELEQADKCENFCYYFEVSTGHVLPAVAQRHKFDLFVESKQGRCGRCKLNLKIINNYLLFLVRFAPGMASSRLFERKTSKRLSLLRSRIPPPATIQYLRRVGRRFGLDALYCDKYEQACTQWPGVFRALLCHVVHSQHAERRIKCLHAN